MHVQLVSASITSLRCAAFVAKQAEDACQPSIGETAVDLTHATHYDLHHRSNVADVNVFLHPGLMIFKQYDTLFADASNELREYRSTNINPYRASQCAS